MSKDTTRTETRSYNKGREKKEKNNLDKLAKVANMSFTLMSQKKRSNDDE